MGRRFFIQYSLRSLSSDTILRQLDEFELDIGFTYLDREVQAGFEVLRLYRERYVLMSRADAGGNASPNRWDAMESPRILAHREELMPRLVNVSSLDPDAQAEISDSLFREASASRPPVCCAWLASDARIEDLTHHIARYLVGPDADGRAAFWRFYDPRVLALTLAVFDPVQRATLLGPVTDWQFPWAGHRWTVAGPGTPNDDSHGYMPAWPKPDQWLRISRSEAASRVVDRLSTMAPEKAAQLPRNWTGSLLRPPSVAGCAIWIRSPTTHGIACGTVKHSNSIQSCSMHGPHCYKGKCSGRIDREA